MAPKGKRAGPNTKRSEYTDKKKPTEIRYSNISAAKGVF